ncbi:MAG: hypothetical protein KAQ99_03515, partial [Candidatus Aureabacteria bacterium]|nr:hypothetical protein [Candidatus Auribacterota bacterium]
YCPYNTSNPDTRIEVISPSGYAPATEADSYISATGSIVTAPRISASGGAAIAGEGNVTYDLNIAENIEDAVIKLRYSAVGTGSIDIFLDGVLVDLGTEPVFQLTENSDTYLMTRELYLTDLLTAGAHTLMFVLTAPAVNIEIDYFAVYSGLPPGEEPEPPFADEKDFKYTVDSSVYFQSDLYDSDRPETTLQYYYDRDNPQRYHGTKDKVSFRVVFDKSRLYNSDTDVVDLKVISQNDAEAINDAGLAVVDAESDKVLRWTNLNNTSNECQAALINAGVSDVAGVLLSWERSKEAYEDPDSLRKYGFFGMLVPSQDFSESDYFSFWVYNDGTPLKFKARIEDSRGPRKKMTEDGKKIVFGVWESGWAGIEPRMVTDAADWENLVVDLTRSFSAHDTEWDKDWDPDEILSEGAVGKLDLTDITRICFLVEPEDAFATGIFWLDDIILSRAPETAPLEAFETDFYGWTGGDVTDIEFLDMVEEDSFKYFWFEYNSNNGLIKDGNWSGKQCSIAAVGFGLTSYCIAVNRGWIPEAQGRERAEQVLTTLWNAPQGDGEIGTAGYKGFFYHNLDMDTGLRSGESKLSPMDSELSSIDTALLMAGALTAGRYFGGNVQTLAKNLYERVDWDWMRNGGDTLSMGWNPGTGFLANKWEGYNESMILYLLAIGSPTYPIPASSWVSADWTRDVATALSGGPLYYVSEGPLFAYQYSHAYIDFYGKTVNGWNWFDNSRTAVLSNRQFCINDKGTYPTYDYFCWGLSACTYKTDEEGGEGYRVYGAPPPADALHDGTVAPYAAAASVIFAPEYAIPTL